MVMMRTLSFLLVFIALGFSTPLALQNGWNLKGLGNDVNVSTFDNRCVDAVWSYEGAWKLYLPKGSPLTNSVDIAPLITLKSGKGFWASTQENCAIDFEQDLASVQNFYPAVNNSGQVVEESFNGFTLKVMASTNLLGVTSQNTKSVRVTINGNNTNALLKINDTYNSNIAVLVYNSTRALVATSDIASSDAVVVDLGTLRISEE
jgi:hypothetical protein